jgi:hypothetical protein
MAERKRMTTRVKELFEQKQFFVMAGGMNPIGAKMAEVRGYEVCSRSGGNTSAHQLGWPDSGSSMRERVDNARKIVLTVPIPVFADAARATATRSTHTARCGSLCRPASPDVTLRTRPSPRSRGHAAAASPSRKWWASSGRRWTPRGNSTRTLSSWPGETSEASQEQPLQRSSHAASPTKKRPGWTWCVRTIGRPGTRCKRPYGAARGQWCP